MDKEYDDDDIDDDADDEHYYDGDDDHHDYCGTYGYDCSYDFLSGLCGCPWILFFCQLFTKTT